MSIEGQLQFRLTLADGAVSGVEITSSRPVHACRAFHGKHLAESRKLLPLLFSICGTAQACAGVRASERALGVKAAVSVERLRECLVDLEALREHLWRVFLDWPGFIGREVGQEAMVEMAAIERDLRRQLCQGGDPMQPGAVDCQPENRALQETLGRLTALLQKYLFGMPPAQWLSMPDRYALDAWLLSDPGIAAGLLNWVVGSGWSSAGRCESVALPTLEERQLDLALEDDNFVARPQWSGRCCESSSLTRMDTPLLSALKRAHGNGLLVRLMARLSEIAWLAGGLLPSPAGEAGGNAASDPTPVNPGIGQVVAARGHLVHRVTLQGERIQRYQILAPTEWNFHPQGVAAASLGSLRGDRHSVEQQARLLINAIDPCVGYGLELIEE